MSDARVAPARLFSGGKERAFARGLQEAARYAVDESLAVRPDERMLVVTEPDPEVAPVAMALHDAAVAAGAEVLFVAQPPREPDAIADPGLMRVLETDPDIIAVLTRGGLGADPERIARPVHRTYTHYLHYLIGEARSRGFWAPGITPRVFAKTVPVDRAAMDAVARPLMDLLAETVELRVRTPRAELVVPVDGGNAVWESGDHREPGKAGTLPAGQICIPVREALAEGQIMVDGTLGLPSGDVPVKDALRFQAKDGAVSLAAGGPAAERVEAAWAAAPALADRAVANGWLTRDEAAVYGANASRLSEVRIGLNPAARPVGHVLVDGIAQGALTLGIGARAQEHPPRAPVSVQAVVRRPEVVAVLEDGTEQVLVQKGSPVRPLVA